MFEKTDTHLLIGFLNHEFVRRAIYKQIGELVMLVHYQCLSLCIIVFCYFYFTSVYKCKLNFGSIRKLLKKLLSMKSQKTARFI